MSLWSIAWRSIRQRWLASTLTGVSMALGVALVVTSLLALGVLGNYFQRNMSMYYNVIVGPKGGKLQLVLNTVYHLSTPVENISWDFYTSLLPADHRHARVVDGKKVAGELGQYVEQAIPFCLGDNYEGFRVVGTIPEFLASPYASDSQGQPIYYALAEGRNFTVKGYFEGVVGATVAARTGLKVGDTFEPTHGVSEGAEDHHHDPFKIVGVLAPTGTPHDRAIFVNIEGFYMLEGHDKSGKSKHRKDEPAAPAGAAAAAGHDDHAGHDHGHSHEPLPLEEREVTAVLVRTNSLVAGLQLPVFVNEGLNGQAVLPVQEITTLMDAFVTPFQWLMVGMTTLVVIVSGVSILVSIYNSMSDRKRDIAILRALGARRRQVMQVILLESLILSLLAGVAGWLLARGGAVILGSLYVTPLTGVSLGPLDYVPLAYFAGQSIADRLPFLNYVPVELALVPALMLLATIVGWLPAASAYRTDVADGLTPTA
ncbi:MAG TPA: FtsX-like permease family protein [Pirellulales bacterium]